MAETPTSLPPKPVCFGAGGVTLSYPMAVKLLAALVIACGGGAMVSTIVGRLNPTVAATAPANNADMINELKSLNEKLAPLPRLCEDVSGLLRTVQSHSLEIERLKTLTERKDK